MGPCSQLQLARWDHLVLHAFCQGREQVLLVNAQQGASKGSTNASDM
jgi:hypothetical protein